MKNAQLPYIDDVKKYIIDILNRDGSNIKVNTDSNCVTDINVLGYDGLIDLIDIQINDAIQIAEMWKKAKEELERRKTFIMIAVEKLRACEHSRQLKKLDKVN